MVETFMPSAELKPYVRCYKLISPGHDIINRIVPDTSITLGICIKGQVNYHDGSKDLILPATIVSGLRKSYRLVHYHPAAAMLVAMFTVTGANAFLRRPLTEVFEQTISLADLVTTSEANLLEEMIGLAKTNKYKIRLLENFLKKNIDRVKPDLLVAAAIDNIGKSGGNFRVHELSRQLFISEDAFTKRFRKHTGSTPRQYGDIIRMKSALQIVRTSTDLTAAALNAGFFDQAHFIKAFKVFTGLTPSAFRHGSSLW
jgi:AraC-like DNA-binding protein